MTGSSNQVRGHAAVRALRTAAKARARSGPQKGGLLVVCALAVAAGLAGCGESVSTSSYAGEAKRVATRISDFQKDVTETSQKKICTNDLAAVLKDKIAASTEPTEAAPVGGAKSSVSKHTAVSTEREGAVGKVCEASIKEQLKDVESLTMNIRSVAVSGKTATASVVSTWSGKEQLATVHLVKEHDTWLIAGL